MNRFASRMLSAVMLAGAAACGELPQDEATPADVAAPGPAAQLISFTGVADPATGRLQIVMGPQAAIVKIPEDADGNANTAAPATAQVHGPAVSWLAGGVGYPAACVPPYAPYLMLADVDVLSGFKEQLRNVYAKITTMSGGQTFCSKDPVGSFGAILNPNSGLYRYQPLDPGTNANSAIRRSLPWALNLPDVGAFWFSGELWAEVIPQAPSNVTPVDGNVLHVASPTTSARVTFRWTNDPLANGSNPEGFVVDRPTGRGARITIYQCGTGATPDPVCSTSIHYQGSSTGTRLTRRSGLTPGWYQWTIEAAFQLRPSFTTHYGRTTARYFQVVTP